MKRQKTLNVLLIVLPGIAVILTAMPNAIKIFFSNDGVNRIVEYCSGFDMLLIGYGNPMPLLAGIEAGVTALFGVMRCFRSKEKMTRYLQNMACCGAAAWTAIGAFGARMTVVSFAALVLMVVTAYLAHSLCRNQSK